MKGMLSKASASVVRPVPVDVDPAVIAETDNHDRIADQLAGEEATLCGIESKTGSSLGEVATQVVDGMPLAVAVKAADLRTERTAIVERIGVLTKAKFIASNRVRDARKIATDNYVTAFAEQEMLPLQREGALALIAIGKIQDRFSDAVDRVQREASIEWPISSRGPAGFGRLGSPRDEGSLFAAWLTCAVQCGIIELSEIPAEWREDWSALADLNKRDVHPATAAQARAKLARLAGEASAPSARARAADRSARRGGSRSGPR